MSDLVKRPERLTRWMLGHTQPKPLSIDHPAMDDIAWAADELERQAAEVERLKREAADIQRRDYRLKIEIDNLHKALGKPSITAMNPHAEDTILAGAVIRYAIAEVERLKGEVSNAEEAARTVASAEIPNKYLAFRQLAEELANYPREQPGGICRFCGSMEEHDAGCIAARAEELLNGRQVMP